MKIKTEILLKMEVGMPQGSGMKKGPAQGCGCGCQGPGSKHHHDPNQVCVCMVCGKQKEHQPGDPCAMGKCAHCGGDLVRLA